MSSPNRSAAQRPTHVGLELRLTIEEAEALEIDLATFSRLIDRKIVTVSPDRRHALLSGLRKLLSGLTQRLPPFQQ